MITMTDDRLGAGEDGELHIGDAWRQQRRYEEGQARRAYEFILKRRARERRQRWACAAAVVLLVMVLLWSGVLDVQRDHSGDITITSCSPWPSCVRLP